MRQQWIGYACVAASALGFGLMPLFAVFAYGEGLSVHATLFWRFCLAAALLLPLAVWQARRHWSRVTGRGMVGAFAMGAVLYTGQALSYFTAVKLAGPSLAAVLLYIYPGVVAVAECVMHRRRPTARLLLALGLLLVGVALSVGPLGAVTWPGVAAGLAAGLIYSTYIMVGARVSRGMPTYAMSELVLVGSLVGLSVTGVATGQLQFSVPASAWWILIGIAVFSTIVGIMFFLLAMVRIGPTRASVGSTLELVTSIVAATVVLQAALDGCQWLGAGLVLAGAILGMVSGAKRVPEPSH